MGMTAAERQNKRRQKLKEDGKYEEYKKYHKMVMRKSREKLKNQHKNLSKSQQEELKRKARLVVKQRVAKHRALKRAKLFQGTTPLNPETPVYKSSSTLGKAVAKVKRALPSTPKRRVAVIRKLFNREIGDIQAEQKTSMGTKSISKETVESAKYFYQRDGISRQAPGRKDVVTIRDNGEKTKIQMRHLVYSLKEAYEIFKSDHPEITIGKSKFADLRPKHVLLSSKLPHNVCMCKYHENFINAVNALHKVHEQIPKYSKDVPQTLLCENANEACWLNQCTDCQNGKGFQEKYALNDAHGLSSQTWYIWKTMEDCRLEKVVEEGTTEDLKSYMIDLIPKFLEHCYIKRAQAEEYNVQREACSKVSTKFAPKIGLMQVDFSENYTCGYQDEIQSAHWQQNQVSLFTAAIWYSGSLHPTVIASDNLTHSTNSIIAYLSKLLDTIPEEIKELRVWSDGPSSQFKNKYITAALPVLEKVHKIKIIWNFFATSHGKGPVDGIGGVLKRQVWLAVKRRDFIVTNAASFATGWKFSKWTSH